MNDSVPALPISNTPIQNTSVPNTRVPNLLHVLFFLALTIFAMIPSEALVLTLRHGAPIAAALADQRLQTIATVLTYVIALAMAFIVIPAFWQRPFLAGLNWNAAAVRPWLVLLGLVVGFAAQGLNVLFPVKNDLPIEEIFRSPGAIWFLAFLGVMVAPLFEEIFFRGFLLPAIAIATDWIRVPRDPDPVLALENLAAWRSREDYSTPALVVSSLLTSVFFVLIHGPQLAWTLSAMGLLMLVSLLLCVVRIRTRSVAASALTHGCYNLSVFVTLFVATGGFRHLDKM